MSPALRSPKKRTVIYGVTDRRYDPLLQRIDDYLVDHSSVSGKEKGRFFHALQLLVNSGVRFVRAIEMLSERQRNTRFARILATIAYDMKTSGMHFSQAMSKYPQVFSESEQKMVYSGELTGHVERTLQDIAIQIEKNITLQRRVKSALMYPITVLGAVVVAIAIVMVFVVPQFMSLFESFGGELPLATKFMIFLSEAFTQYWWAALGIIGFAWGMFSQWRATEHGKYLWSKLLLELPGIGGLIQNIQTTRIALNLSTLLKADIALNKALSILSEILPNRVMRQSITQIEKDVAAGVQMYESFAQQVYIDPILAEVIEVGSQTGNVPEILHKTGVQYEQEVDAQLKNISQLIEPIVLLVVAGVVVFMAYAILSPIFELQGMVSTNA